MGTKLIGVAVVVVAVLAGVSAAQPVPPAPSPAKVAVKQAFDASPTLHGDSISGQLLQIVAEIVVDRAKQAGLEVLAKRLKKSLDCDATTTSYPKTCKLLRELRIQDVLTSPTGLLETVIPEVGGVLRSKVDALLNNSPALKLGVEVTVGVAGVVSLWRSQKGGASGAIFTIIKDKAIEAAGSTCPPEAQSLPFDHASTKAVWGVAMCIATHNPVSDVKGALAPATCDIEATITTGCGNGSYDADTKAASLHLIGALTNADKIAAAESLVTFVTNGAAGRIRTSNAADKNCFAAEDPNTNLCAALVDDLGVTANGLIGEEWSEVARGLVAALHDYGARAGADKISGTRFFQLLSAIGAYSLTYADSTNPVQSAADAKKARKDIVEALVKDMTNRGERSGWVFSVGGSFGVAGMYRHAINGSEHGFSGPFALPIGIGLQYYNSPESTCGFHAQLGIFDLGQYVTFEKDHDMTVGEPNSKAALAVSGSVGMWFGSRSTPIFIGPYGGFAPFVLQSGKPEYFVGGMLGAYVPLLDF